MATPCSQAAFYLSFGAGIGRQLTGADLASPHNAGFATITTYTRSRRIVGGVIDAQGRAGRSFNIYRYSTATTTMVVPLGGQRSQTAPQSTPTYTQEMSDCDWKLARIFGGGLAVGAGFGFEPKGGVVAAYDGKFRGGPGGHLSDRAMHLYGNNAKTQSTGVYIPAGADSMYANPRTLPEYKGGSFVAFYSNLEGLQNVSLIATHVANFTNSSDKTNNAGSQHIGFIGGRGGEGANYIHAHFELVQGRVTPNKSTTAMKHYSFAEVFCK